MNPSDEYIESDPAEVAALAKQFAKSCSAVMTPLDKPSDPNPAEAAIVDRFAKFCAATFDETLNDVAAELHKDASMIESAGAEALSQSRLGEAHKKFDLARSLRIAANYLLGVESA